MADLKEQYVCIKFCIKLRKNATGTSKTLKVAFEDAECVRCLSVSKMDESVVCMKDVIIISKRITICKVANMLGISLESVQRTLKKSDLESGSGDWFPADSALSVPEFLPKK
jgi:hypothetical protein